MFALSQNLSKTAARRAISTTSKIAASVVPKNHFIPEQYATNFTKSYMSDPATYPLIVIMGFAMTICVGMTVNAMARYRGVKVRAEHKHSEMITWPEADKPYVPVTESWSRNLPVGWYAEGFKSLRHEGLGIDHEKWTKEKEAAKRT